MPTRGAQLTLGEAIAPVLKKAAFEFRRRDGEWKPLERLVFDIGDAAAVLPYDAARGTVLLLRQFRLPAYMSGKGGFLVEACAGKLDGDDPATCARRETEEELGYRLPGSYRTFLKAAGGCAPKGVALDPELGLLIDQPPSSLNSADNRAAAAANLEAFKRRLRLLGSFDGLSDDFSAQYVRNPLEIA